MSKLLSTLKIGGLAGGIIAVWSVFVFGSVGYGQAPGSLSVSFIDVGEGDSIWLHASDGTDVLVDGGPPSAGPTVVAYLQRKGIDDVDVLVVSHADSDHTGGLIDVLRSTIPVDAIIYNGLDASTSTYASLLSEMQRRGLTPTPAKVGQAYSWGPIEASVLNPQTTPTGNQNEDSVVVLAAYGSRRFLLTGDIGSSTEQAIVALGTPVPADVLKVAHHGSKYSSSSSFLGAASPEIAVISVGANNGYGHPAQETLDRLGAIGANVLRTDQEGTIILNTDGTSLDVVESYALYLPVIVRTRSFDSTSRGSE